MSALTIQTLSATEDLKVAQALRFIALLTDIAKMHDVRVVIAGGYAVDGFLKEVTRFHNDIDIQLYTKSRDPLILVTDLLSIVSKTQTAFTYSLIEDKGRSEYYHNFIVKFPDFGADIYVLQTLGDPFAANKVIIKSDMSFSEEHPFDTQTTILRGASFEIQGPLTEIVDKIYKRDHRGDPKEAKHDQDIKNLQQFLSEDEVAQRLAERLEKI